MSEQSGDPANAGQIAHWNSPIMRSWADQHDMIDGFFTPVTERLLAFAAPRSGERAIDIGCGSGTTALELAKAVGPAGAVLGVDVAEASVALANARIAGAGMAQARVGLGDATVFPFDPATYDLAFTRFGVMFFADPTASFRNIHRAMKPGGRLALGVFRRPQENPWATGPVGAIADLMPAAPPPGPEDPGQFSFADPDRVRRILAGAGFSGIELTPFDPPMQLGPVGGAAEAARFATRVGPVSRAIGQAAPETAEAMVQRLHAYFAGVEGPDGIVLPAGLWLVSARA